MIKKIDKPDWTGFIRPWLEDNINKWFDREVEPVNRMIENAVEVRGHGTDRWYRWYRNNGNSTHRAYLIGIEEIKRDTAIDVLRDYVKHYSKSATEDIERYNQTFMDLYQRAKRVLEGEGNE